MFQGKYPLLLALAFGMTAGLIAYSWEKSIALRVREGWNPKRVLCAQRDMDEGTELDESMVDVCEMPEKYITASFIQVPDDGSIQNLIPFGEKLIVPLKKSDPLLYSHFETRTAFGLSDAVPEQMLAVSIEVSEKASVSQLIRPNDHVDVIGVFRDTDGARNEQTSTLLFQNIIVLATGHHTGIQPTTADEDRRFSVVTLMVTPREAEILALAEESGMLKLGLRGPSDLHQIEPDGLKVADFLPIEKKEAVARKNQQMIQIDRGPNPTQFEPVGPLKH